MAPVSSLFTSPGTYVVDPTLAHRRGQAVVTVLDAAGKPVADAPVTVEQTNHQFLFGNIGFELIDWINGSSDGAQDEQWGSGSAEYYQQFADRWLEVFNSATMPFYWGSFEPEQGKPHTAPLMKACQWFADRGVSLKGHPLVWHTAQPSWMVGKPVKETAALLRARIRREVGDFAGLVDLWDAINETVIMPVFTAEENATTPLARDRGRAAMVRLAMEEARTANPQVKLILNDFDMSTAYEAVIELVLEAGIRIDYLGLQSHQHQGYWGKEKLLRILDRFSRYNIPIHFTETTMLSGDVMPDHIVDLNDWQVDEWPSTEEGEARQADELEEWYRTLVAHPAVHAITYWGLGDRGMWLNAPGGLLRADASPKPSFERLKGLIRNEWWLSATQRRTNAAGQVTVEGFKGTYAVTAPDGAVTDVVVP
ncbi:MAG: endo-1,4-beta-xylanase [Cellulomonadaceae bacterium]|nr:endo-1,4-beta-xylanase [Cellulomonadaceae bacterium]